MQGSPPPNPRALPHPSNSSSALTSSQHPSTKHPLAKSSAIHRSSYLNCQQPSPRPTLSRSGSNTKRQFLKVVSSQKDLLGQNWKSRKLSSVRSHSLMIGFDSRVEYGRGSSAAKTARNKVVAGSGSKSKGEEMRMSMPVSIKFTQFLHPKKSLQLSRTPQHSERQLSKSQSTYLQPSARLIPQTSQTSQFFQNSQTSQASRPSHKEVMKKLGQDEYMLTPSKVYKAVNSLSDQKAMVMQARPVYRVISSRQIVKDEGNHQKVEQVVKVIQNTPMKVECKRDMEDMEVANSIKIEENDKVKIEEKDKEKEKEENKNKERKQSENLTTSAFFQQMPSYIPTKNVYELSAQMMVIQKQRQQVENRISQKLDTISQKASSMLRPNKIQQQTITGIQNQQNRRGSSQKQIRQQIISVEKEGNASRVRESIDCQRQINAQSFGWVGQMEMEEQPSRLPFADKSQASNVGQASLMIVDQSPKAPKKAGKIKSQSTVFSKNTENEPPMTVSQLRQHILSRIYS